MTYPTFAIVTGFKPEFFFDIVTSPPLHDCARICFILCLWGSTWKVAWAPVVLRILSSAAVPRLASNLTPNLPFTRGGPEGPKKSLVREKDFPPPSGKRKLPRLHIARIDFFKGVRKMDQWFCTLIESKQANCTNWTWNMARPTM